jgi:redox-sensitive bicupin YhaK (pirin superfamily)
MDVIHFTHNATDRLRSFGARGARFLPLADGTCDTHVSCLHLEEGARIPAPSTTHGATLLLVHGRITITTQHDARIDFSGGMGAIFDKGEPYSIDTSTGAIILIVEADELVPHPRGISTPERITGATWPRDAATQLRLIDGGRHGDIHSSP